jgi:hypothetical protein
MNQNLNNTLEEQLRLIICDQQTEIKGLRASISVLEQSVAEEQEAKYRAYIKYADLKKEKNDKTSI